MTAMAVSVSSTVARLLPRGAADLLRQIVLFCGAYWLYRLVRGQVDGRAAAAFANAQDIVSAERSLGLFFEPSVHAWTEAHALVADTASWLYVNSHFTVTTATLAFVYLRRNDRFYFVRNMFMVAMALALVLYVLVPTAPPRFFPELGFSDPVAELTGVEVDDSSLLVNPYAAVPSMHVAFAIMLGLPMARMVSRRWLAALWHVYPFVVTAVVVVTANHWWIDAVLGALTAAIAYAFAAGLFGRVRPDAWAWNRVPSPSGA
jgi:hypothetical protein